MQDTTGVPHLGGSEAWSFEADKHTPTTTLCMIYTAWDALIQTGAKVAEPMAEPFRYILYYLISFILNTHIYMYYPYYKSCSYS